MKLKSKFIVLTFVIFMGTSFNMTLQSFDNGCNTYCTYNGCDVAFYQGESSWSYVVWCPYDEYFDGDAGSGTFGGTLCDGVEPCSPGASIPGEA